MRALVATDQWYPDLRGGVARVAADTARLLAVAGHEVVVLAPQVPGTPEVTADGRLTLQRVLPRSVLPRTATDVVAAAVAARRAEGEFDLLLAHQTTTAVGMRAGRPHTPLALVFHASAPLELRFVRKRTPFGPRRLAMYALDGYLSALERAALRSAASVLVLSEFSRSLLPPRARGRALQVGGGVDVERFGPGDGPGAARSRLGLSSGGPLVVTVRRLEPRMGIEQLLGAIALLPVEVTLAVVGGGSLDGRLRSLAASLGVAERVRFVGRVADEELVDWYRAADVFALPSVAYEGFGLATAEALACGTPVVGTPVGATPEILRPLDERFVAAGADAEALAGALGEVLATADGEVRRRCREYAETHLAWRAVLPAWERALAGTAFDGARAHGPDGVVVSS